MKKVLCTLAGATALLLAIGAPASAHVSPSQSEVPADSFVAVTFRIGHGCEGEGGDTDRVEIQMPEGVDSPTPQALPGWEASVSEDGVVTFEGGPLPHDQYLEYGVAFLVPDVAGETLSFPTIQTCESGEEIAWIEETPEGGEEPEEPAPTIAVVESTGDHHGGGGEDEATGDDAASTEEAGDEHADDAGSDSDDDSNALAVVALIVGALGLLSGAYAVLSARRAS